MTRADLQASSTTRVGILTPHLARGPEEELPAMAPRRLVTCVARISSDAADTATLSGLLELTGPELLDEAADVLGLGTLHAVAYASTSSAYALGLDGEAAVAARLTRRLRVPVVATCASAVDALRVLEVERIALVHPPWFGPELNESGADYFVLAGFDVVSSASAIVSPDPERVNLDAVHEWIVRNVSESADAVFVGGNGFRVAGAIARLETALRRPVLTSNQVLLWSILVATDAPFEVHGYGQLFANETRSRARSHDAK
jgi:maleate isomerase